MPEFEKSKGFKMKGPQFFGSALKKYGKAPVKDYDVKKGSHDHPHGKSGTPGDAGQMKMPQPGDAGRAADPRARRAGEMAGKAASPAKGLKDMLGKVKDKLSGGPGAGAGIGMMLGGPLGAAIGGGIGAIRKKRQAKKAAAAEQPGAAPAGVPGAGAGSPEPVPSPMGKRGKKRKIRKLKKKVKKITDKVRGETMAEMASGALMGGAMRTPTKKKEKMVYTMKEGDSEMKIYSKQNKKKGKSKTQGYYAANPEKKGKFYKGTLEGKKKEISEKKFKKQTTRKDKKRIKI